MPGLKNPHGVVSCENGCNSEAGFTLMELIIVCVIISLVLTISIPTLRNSLYTNELTSTARKIIGTVKELRTLAVREHKPYLLHFDIDKNYIWYEPDDGLDFDDGLDIFDEEAPTGLQFPSDIRIEDVHAHSQGKISLGSVVLWVSKRGYMDQTAVHLSDSDDARLTLFFSPFSGSAKVYDDYVEIE